MDFQMADIVESAYRAGRLSFDEYYALGKKRLNPEEIDRYDSQSLRELRFLPYDSAEYKSMYIR